ncbi:MAG: hypothetical protein FWE54_04415 [Methanimicrococcus sp.]|nr:hypothetical protein [Methanimicrococcus sp.]
MNLYDQIFTRKSVRKFDMTSLDSETIQQIETFIAGITPLLPGANFTHKIVGAEEVKGLALPKAPHFLLISGIDQPLRHVCAGFHFQHVELYLYSIGLATRWLGSVKGKQKDPNHIIGFAFGKPAETATRELSEFARKPITEIAKGEDSRLEAARLAPSGLNKQPWYFIVDGNEVHVYYQESLGGLIGMMYKHTGVDAGIALCHMAVAGEHEGKLFKFNAERKNTPAPPKGFAYIGTVE